MMKFCQNINFKKNKIWLKPFKNRIIFFPPAKAGGKSKAGGNLKSWNIPKAGGNSKAGDYYEDSVN